MGRSRELVRAAAALAGATVLLVALHAGAARLPRPWSLAEFPLAVLVVALALALALRRPRPRGAPEATWTRHRQVVRVLPDPEVAPLAQALERWVATGQGAEEAARVLARAETRDPDLRVARASEILDALTGAGGDAKRRAKLLERTLHPPGS